ncbi:hypothetical protein [Malikia sp.]|uniref:hypothetical protein n=1 Tax=Malikia sp. TaxID=2070706 RepID=UPI0026246010|nr:hypothetical protein [Malikia sp.]MDD2730241.1 hypothetical protein [Malikia sp.]
MNQWTDLMYPKNECVAAAAAINDWWIKLDNWTVRQGLLLLTGIDPHRAHCFEFTENGIKAKPPTGTVVGGPTWHSIGAPPDRVIWTDADKAAGRPPVIEDGSAADFYQIYRLNELFQHWGATHLDDRRKPAPPRYFIEYAVRKDLRPFWLDALIETGFKLESDKASPVANQAHVEPVSRFEAQEAEILAAIRAAGRDPLSLPERQAGKPGIKSEIRGRLVGNSKNFPKNGSQFDKAWIRLRASDQIVD